MQKQNRILPIILLALFIIPGSVSGTFQISLNSLMIIPGQQVFFGRETFFQYGFQNSVFALRFINDSYDQFLYGQEVRWGAAGLAVLPCGDFRFSTGAGASLTSALSAGQRLSLDFNLKAEYRWLYAETDALFFSDGLFSRYSLGLEWKILINGQQSITPFIGFGGIMNTDYKKLLNLIAITGGLMYEF